MIDMKIKATQADEPILFPPRPSFKNPPKMEQLSLLEGQVVTAYPRRFAGF